jgi:electron transfer flavoprotein alpha subunit
LSSLAVLEQKDGKLSHGSLGAITAAQKLEGPITAFLAGSNINGVAEEAAKVAGIEKVISVDNAAYDKVPQDLLFTAPCGNTNESGIARELCTFAGREY